MGGCCPSCCGESTDEERARLTNQSYGSTDAASPDTGVLLEGQSENGHDQSPKQGEVEKEKLNAKTPREDSNNKQNGEKRVESKELQKRIKELENELSKAKNENKTLQHQLCEQVQVDKERKTTNKDITLGLTKLNEKNETFQKQIKELGKKLDDKDAIIQELSMKLSTEMSTKVSSDESSIENVAIVNRPTNVAEEYQQICSGAWLEAKKELDEINQEEQDIDKIKLLAHIIQVAEDESKHDMADLIRKRDVFLSEMCYLSADKNMQKDNGDSEDDKQPFDSNFAQKGVTEVTNAIGDLMRNISNKVSLDKIVKQVNDSINVTSGEPSSPVYLKIWSSCQDKEPMNEYIQAVARVTWKMVIQRPPMHFRHAGDKYEANDFEPYWNSDLVENAIIVEVYPALFHGKQKLANGKVFCIDPHKDETQEKTD